MRVAVIPARGGSKRIPRKNLRDFNGQPIIKYAIDAALGSRGLFDRVFVSTDDREIADISRDCGAEVPFLRSPETSDDHAGLLEVMAEFDLRIKNQGVTTSELCCILPTSPLLKSEALNLSYDLFSREQYDSVFPIVLYSYPIQRAVRLDKETGKCYMIDPSFYPTRSQDCEPTYHDAGQFYWIRITEGWQLRPLITGNAGGMIVSEMSAQDIDTEEDWKLCEQKHRLLMAHGSP